jgi:multiple sugar transport system substrate-binding protein
MGRTVHRRSLLQAGLGLGAGLSIGANSGRARAQSPVTLSMTSWGAPAELEGFNGLIAKYKEIRPGVTIKLEVVPSGQYYQQLDTRFAGRQAPDLFRAQYQQIGRYAQSAAAIDLTPYLDKNFGDAFIPSVWKAVILDGKVHALPQHTDTFALFYNADILEKLGVEPPRSIDKSWSWGEFISVAKLVKEKSGLTFPFAMNWQFSNAYRWLIYLYQHGGRLLDSDLKAPAIDSPAGIETIAWTQSWFTEGLVPPNTSLKSSQPIQNLFANGTIALMLNGDWQIPFVDQQAKFRWGVTYMLRDVAMASDLGGNAFAVSRDSKNPEAAAEFLKFIVAEDSMRYFVAKAQLLPVRKSLVAGGVDFALRPDEMKVFIEQSKTVPEHLVGTVVLPNWGRFNAKLADELELAFTSGQAADLTARNIDKHARAMLVSPS